MLETELKCIITEELYNKIKSSFKWNYTAEQINTYYTDAEGELQKRRAMVRVRVKNGVSKLQIKLHKNPGNPLQICDEIEYPIDGVPESIPAEKIAEAVGFKTGDLFRMGSASTLRSSLMWDKSTEICLDKTTYFDVTDYEIEIEYSGTLDKQLIEKLKTLGVQFRESSVGKFSRFLRKFEESNKK